MRSQRGRCAVGSILASAALASCPVAAAPADDFQTLLDDHYAWLLRENPVQATAIGVRRHDSKIDDISEAADVRRTKQSQVFLDRLEAISADALVPARRIDHAILGRMLREDIEAQRHGQRAMLFTTYYGWQQSFAGLAGRVPLRTKADHDSYLTRIAQYPALNDAALQITADGLARGHMLPCSVLGGFEKGIAGVVTADVEHSRFYQPFLRPRPADASQAEWEALQARARAIITEVLNPAYAKHLDFYLTRYAPRCAATDSIADQPGGAEFYRFRLRQATTTDLTPDQIHEIGLVEAARIRAEMEVVAAEAGFASREAFIADLRTNPRYYADTPEQLMKEVARVTKDIDGKMPGLFGALPRLPYGLREIPAEIAEGTTTAYYNAGSPEAGLAGTYFVNTSKLDQRPLWEIPALSVHEAVPGHHHQISLQQEMDLPPFRRHFTSFTAFTEGWGLYAESLGEEMGLYDTPAKKMGQLSYQMWRAARMVVDTGLHAKGWGKARAIAYMTENTALSAANIEAEVNRYISGPAHAPAYMLGAIRLRDLRAKAQKTLGDRFDLRAFHDAVLRQGSVPLDILEVQIDAWIAEQAG